MDALWCGNKPVSHHENHYMTEFMWTNCVFLKLLLSLIGLLLLNSIRKVNAAKYASSKCNWSFCPQVKLC